MSTAASQANTEAPDSTQASKDASQATIEAPDGIISDMKSLKVLKLTKGQKDIDFGEENSAAKEVDERTYVLDYLT